MKNIINILLVIVCMSLVYYAGTNKSTTIVHKDVTSQQKEFAENEVNDYKEAISIAKDTNKNILLVFHAKWCVPCQKMDYEVFKSLRFKWKIKQKDLLKTSVDIDQEKNKDLVIKYNIKTVPYYIVLDKNENVIKKDQGFKSLKEFLSWLD